MYLVQTRDQFKYHTLLQHCVAYNPFELSRQDDLYKIGVHVIGAKSACGKTSLIKYLENGIEFVKEDVQHGVEATANMKIQVSGLGNCLMHVQEGFSKRYDWHVVLVVFSLEQIDEIIKELENVCYCF